jgi:DNA topoisomerase IB
VPRLRRIDCSEPGLRRRRRGRGFEYLDADGTRLTDEATVERIRALAIPPAWEEVWICPDPNGHLQATGVDAAGRKQYRYHDRWRERRDQAKFDEMLEFAAGLPRLRRRVLKDLRGEDLGREQVLACAVRLLDRGFFRIGSEDYAERNESYGLATIQKAHVAVRGDEMTFDYPAKSGQRRVLRVIDPEIAGIVAALRRRRGGTDDLLAYRRSRRWRDVTSVEINAYVKEATGGDFSAKDFRTWNATVLAAVALAVSGEVAGTKTGRRRAISRAVKEVAHYLGNTPTVCRASYIDPRVFDAYNAGLTIGGALEAIGEVHRNGGPPVHAAIDEAVVDLLVREEDSSAIERVRA